MNKTMRLSLTAAMAVVGASALVACGHDSSTSSKKKTNAINDYKELPACTLKNDAEKATADGDDAVYVCKDKNWEILDTSFVANDTAKTLDDIPNCADEQDGNSYYIQKTGVNYICENERWEIVIAKEEEKSSSSVIPGSDPESTGSKDEAKSSASTVKSSGSTAKSSSSVTPSKVEGSSDSKSDAKSSSSEAKSSDSKSDDAKSSSATAISENESETFDDLPNCTETREGLIYFVKKENANYQCIYTETKSRIWSKVETCGKSTITVETQFCADGKPYEKCGTSAYDPVKEFCVEGKSYEKCGTKTYDPSMEFCADGKPYEKCGTKSYDPLKEFCDAGTVTELCGGKPYNSKNTTCIDGKVAYGMFDVSAGGVILYTDGESVYFDRWVSGDFANAEGGCLYMAEKELAEMETQVSTVVGKTKSEILGMGVPGGTLLYLMIMSSGNISIDVSDCDYDYTLKASRAFDDDFTEEVVLEYYDAFKTVAGTEHGYKAGDYRYCRGTKGSSDLTDIESQFCYDGKVYDRCGGTTFATSKVYNPVDSVCVDGALVPVEKCGSEPLDKDKQFCVDGKAYDKALYCDNTLSYPTKDYICVAEGSGYSEVALSKAEYEECADGIYAEKKDEFCQDGDVYELCDGNSYDATTYFCYDKVEHEKSKYAVCDDANNVYELNTQFCMPTGILEKSDYCNADDDQDQYPLTDYYCVEEEGAQTPYAKDEYTECDSKYYKTLATGACVSTTVDGVATYDYMEIPEALYFVNQYVPYTGYSYTASTGARVWGGRLPSGVDDEFYSSVISAIGEAGYTEDSYNDDGNAVKATYISGEYTVQVVYNKTNHSLRMSGIQSTK